MIIKLTNSEIYQGANVGVLRQVQNLQVGAKPAYGEEGEKDWQKNIEGALAEMALAKHLGVYWSKGNWKDLDVGEVECRSAQEHFHKLIIRPEDRDHARMDLRG